MRIIFYILLLHSSWAYGAKILEEMRSVNPYTLPGDSERNQLPVEGLLIHEANDYYGRTDKLISGSASLTLLENYKKYFSTSLGYKGRYVQPIIRTRNDEPKLDNKIGIYAEWAELSLNQSITIFSDDESWAIKLDGGVTYNDFGDHGFADVYEFVHEAVADQNETDEFGEKVYANFIGSSWGASFIIPFGDYVNFMASYEVMNSKVFREDAMEGTIVIRGNKNFGLSLKYSFVKQKRSEYYNLSHHRQQFIGALRLFTFWTPSIMYVSPYVRGDDYGQWYLSPISFTYPF